MTRFKLTLWLAIPALLLIGPVAPIAHAATPGLPTEDGLFYLPLEQAQMMDAAANSVLGTSAVAGEATIAQYGDADVLVSNRGRFLSVRFEPPFSTAYTVSGLSFASWVAIPNPALPFASFRSVRVYGADAGGNLDKSQLLYRQNRYWGSNVGATNVIPLSIAGSPGQAFYAVFEFPTPVSGVADTFPFLSTDRQFTDEGLFMNSFASDTSGNPGVPASPGTLVGTTQLMDQNVHAALTCVLGAGEQAPAAPPAHLGLRLVAPHLEDEIEIASEFAYDNPPHGRVDGTSGNSNGVELVRRDGGSWTVVSATGAGSEKFRLGVLAPGAIYGTRSIAGTARSWVSNVTITGNPGAVVAMGGSLGEDANEPNSDQEFGATAVTVPFEGQATIWPAGDEDYYRVSASGGDVINATATAANVDFRNDLDPVVIIMGTNGNALAIGTSAGPGEPATASYVVSKNGTAQYWVLVVDRAGSVLDPSTGQRVLLPANYNVSIEVQTPAAIQQFAPDAAPAAGLLDPDHFAFANLGANPVRGQANLGYVIPRSSRNGAAVSLRIYDVRGRHIATLENSSKAAGRYAVSWSGHDSRGNRAPSGPYFARLAAGNYKATVRIDLVK